MEVKQLVVVLVPLIFIISTGLVNTAGMVMPVTSYFEYAAPCLT